MQFIITGNYYKKNCMPSMNDYILKCRYNKFGANNFKKEYQSIAISAIREAKIKPVEKPITLIFTFGETSRKRDYDNVASFAIKVILDALQDTGIIPNDNQKWVKGWQCFFEETKEPYIKVEIENA